MDWSRFIAHIKGLGFTGDGSDYPTVINWLKAEKHNTEVATDADGATYELKSLFDDRPGKPMDLTVAVKAANEEERIDALVKQRLAAIENSTGLAVGGTGGRTVHRHDITVGKARIADDPKGGFTHFGGFCKDVIDACNREHPVLSKSLELYQKTAATTYGAEGTGADGGFAVPPQFRDSIVSRVMGEDSILSRTDQIPMSSNAISFPEDETTPWQTTGGILAFWEGEAASLTQSKPALKLKQLRPRKVTALVPITEELLEDSTAMGSYVTRKAGEKIDFKVGEAIFRGTGAGQPLGFLNGGSKIAQAKVTGQNATTIVGANVIGMWARMYAPWRRNSVWFINQDTEPELMQMSVAGKTSQGSAASGYGNIVYLPANSVAGTPYATLFGRPVIGTERNCATLGTEGDIILADMNQYVTGIRGGLASATSIHLWFDQDMVAFKFRMRIDGQPWMTAPITPRSGSTNTLSAFVTLATRA